MFRLISRALLFAAVLAAPGCGESKSEASFVSEAVAASPAQTPDYGWRTNASPNAVDGTVVDYQ